MEFPEPKTELTLLHGTTVSRAESIVEKQMFGTSEPLYVVLEHHRDLAEYFARRKAGRERGQAAIVRVTLGDADFQKLRRHGNATLTTFDPADNPLLRSRNQWVISVAGVHILNRTLNEIDYQVLDE